MLVLKAPDDTPTPATISPTSPLDTNPMPTLMDLELSLRKRRDGSPHGFCHVKWEYYTQVLSLITFLLPCPLNLVGASCDCIAQIKQTRNDGESLAFLTGYVWTSYLGIKRLYLIKCREINNKRDRRNVGIWNLSDASIWLLCRQEA